MNTNRNVLPYWLSAPGALAVLALMGVPLVMTLSLSFFGLQPGGQIDNTITLQNYAHLVSDDYYAGIFLRTLLLSLAVTCSCILIGVPEAYVLSRLSARWRAVSMVVVLGPLLVSVVVRTLGWAILLENEGLINKGLLAIGAIDQPVSLMYSYTGVVLALSHVLVPYMILATWASLQKLDFSTEQAANSLSASSLTVLRRIILPQVIPGVLSGSLIVFALAASAFATPAIIGGRRLKVVSTTIYDEFLNYVNWPMGAALAAVLMVLVVFVTVYANRAIERRFKQVFS